MAYAVVMYLVLLISLSGFSPVVEARSWATEHESCSVWDGIAKQLTTSTSAQQTCTSNGTRPCTRIDCSGAYEYNSRNTGNFFNLGSNTIEVDYCFGIILNHCDRNISLDFYMQVPAKHVNKTTRVYHNTLLSIPGLSYSVSGTSAQGYLYFQMERHEDSVTFSVTIKVRISFPGFKTWPSALQRRLISNETVPVPPCAPGAANSTSPIPTIPVCKPPHWKDIKTPPTKLSGNDTGSRDRVSGDLGKLCNETQLCSRDPWLACDLATGHCICSPDFKEMADKNTGVRTCLPRIRHGMQCRYDGDCSLQMSERCLKGICQCQEGDVFNGVTQTCESSQKGTRPGGVKPHHVTGIPHIATPPPTTPAEKTGKGTAAVVVGAVIGGLVVLAGILLAAFFAIRRLRCPYHNRQLLLEGEDSDGIM